VVLADDDMLTEYVVADIWRIMNWITTTKKGYLEIAASSEIVHSIVCRELIGKISGRIDLRIRSNLQGGPISTTLIIAVNIETITQHLEAGEIAGVAQSAGGERVRRLGQQF
jgi:hypothetical protein